MNEQTTPGLGRIAIPDERDEQYLMRAVLDAAPQRKHYYTVPAILDQGPLPFCVGFAWRQFLSTGRVVNRGGPHAPYIYHRSRELDNVPRHLDGSTVRGGAKALQELGFITTYVWAWSADTVQDWILAGHGPVTVGTDWFAGMQWPGKRGVMALDGRLLGGHAYLIVGYSSERGMFRIANSHGLGYGQRGRAWLRFEDLDTLLRSRRGEACAATEERVR